MKQLFSLTLLLCCFATLAQQKTTVTIKQEGYGDAHGLRVSFNNQMLEVNEKGDVIFEKEMVLTGPTYGMILQSNGRYSGFWVEPGIAEVVVKKKGFPASLEVEGSKSHAIYNGINHAKDDQAFKRQFLAHSDNDIAIGVLNAKFKFKKFQKSELEEMYNAVPNEKRDLVANLEAYLNTFGIEKIKVGAQLLDFTGTDQEGKAYSTQDYRGKYLLLDFAATGCGPCWAGYPDMIEQSKEYENLQVITYNEDDAIDAWNRIAKDRNIQLHWPVLWTGEKKKEVFEIYNVEGWPLHFLISPEGKVLETWFGSGGNTLANNLKKHIK